jgi:queuosine biosynthesis protein QueC
MHGADRGHVSVSAGILFGQVGFGKRILTVWLSCAFRREALPRTHLQALQHPSSSAWAKPTTHQNEKDMRMSLGHQRRTGSALVMFSGGQDSTTCLAWALQTFDHVETVGFDYGQRHSVELTCRAPIREAIARLEDWGAHLGMDHLIDLSGALAGVGSTAMTAEMEIVINEEGLPNTFVPGRNLMFMTAAAAIAWRRNIKHIVGGMCETDYSGYPDCRDDTGGAQPRHAAALRAGNAIDVDRQGRDLANGRGSWRCAFSEPCARPDP